MSSSDSKRRWQLTVGGICLTLLFAAVFTLGSLTIPFKPSNWRAPLVLYAVTCFVTFALLVLGLILFRTVVRLWVERSSEQLGARFKTKMVLGAMAISLLPVVFMFIVSYSLLNRTLLTWFPRPLEVASEETQKLLTELGSTQIPRLRLLARQALANSSQPDEKFLRNSFAMGSDAVWLVDENGDAVRGGVICDNHRDIHENPICVQSGVLGKLVRILPSGLEIWSAQGENYVASRIPAVTPGHAGGFLICGYKTNPDFVSRFAQVQAQTREYLQEKQDLRALKNQLLLLLALFTMLLLFAVMWVALFLAKQVTVPIQALAEGTREISAGNFNYQVPEQVHDELGALVRSFNTMTSQLRDNREQIDQFTNNLQQAVQELERRRQLIETVLENVPTGVISLDTNGIILRANPAVSRMFGSAASDASSLESLLGTDSARIVQQLMRRSLRMGVVSREIELVVAGRVLHVAATVSALGPRRANTGFVLVFDDLTEMLHAQKSAAWQEVARRIAHEIKNPLTPIQLSAQRLSRFLEKRDSSAAAAPRDPQLVQLVQECSRLIEREVSTLATLVNEFSEFVRFPTAKLALANVNSIVQDAVEVFSGRLDGISLKTVLADHLPSIRADNALLRSVIVNLIDNAAEALESAAHREIFVSTRAHFDSDTIEICVQDTGHGISPQDKDRLFLPDFSTKHRGTGLGLAIAARIISEHGGAIHVEDNFPEGSRFLVELPAIDLTPAAAINHNGVQVS